jgi:hypothetical protein
LRYFQNFPSANHHATRTTPGEVFLEKQDASIQLFIIFPMRYVKKWAETPNFANQNREQGQIDHREMTREKPSRFVLTDKLDIFLGWNRYNPKETSMTRRNRRRPAAVLIGNNTTTASAW